MLAENLTFQLECHGIVSNLYLMIIKYHEILYTYELTQQLTLYQRVIRSVASN